MSVVSLMSLEDVGALFLGPSSLMADPFGPLLDEDEESALSEGLSSPLSSSSSSSSPLSPSRPASVGCKSVSWPSASELLSAQTEPERSKAGDAFSGMDWMTEKLDLNDFDLDSLIGSCDSDEPPSSPEELLACLDMDLDLDSLPFGSTELGLALTFDLPLPEEPVEIKSEPPSPDPAFTLELGSEVSVLPSPEIRLTPPLMVLAPREEASGSDSSDSDSGISVSGSPAHRSDPERSPKPADSSRTKPYSRPDPDAAPAVTSRVKGAPKVVEKKLKKMEQNKTAATRYRQKKRTEQETLSSECAELEKRNHQLQEKAESISREIRYLKDLMEEVRSSKHRRSKAKPQDAVSSG